MNWKLTFFVLMLAIAISSLPTLRSSLRTASTLIKTSYQSQIQALHSRRLSSGFSSLQQHLPTNIEMAAPASEGPLPPTSIPSTKSTAEQKSQPELPKLSAAEFRAYNKLAEMMEYYHNHFRTTWTTLYTACERNKRPQGMSIPQFLSLATQLIHHLSIHHQIEERHIFPILATKMPEFRPDAAMITQHQGIHDGLDALEAYVGSVRSGERELKLSGEGSLKEVMDSFGKTLWTHLDEEVGNLGAENMRRYWSREEMRGFNF